MSKKKWIGKVPLEDDFGGIIVGTFYDGKTVRGYWAIMNITNFGAYGVGLGTGLGQKYQWDEKDGNWYKIDG